jgi:hypothetical protein
MEQFAKQEKVPMVTFERGLRIPGQAEQRSGVKPNRIPG